jgi:hypothetical protein
MHNATDRTEIKSFLNGKACIGERHVAAPSRTHPRVYSQSANTYRTSPRASAMRLQRIEELRVAGSFLCVNSLLYERGAAHRMNYDTPPLGGNCTET